MADIYYFSHSQERKAVARAPSKSDCIAATRCLLSRIAGWTSLVFDTGAASRLVEVEVPEFRYQGVTVGEFRERGSAGPRIEQSIALLHMSRAYDLVTTGHWQGTVQDLVRTHYELSPFHYLLRQSDALVNDFSDPFILPESLVAVVLSILDAFEGRVYLQNKLPLDMRLLSALSGLSEKTVRMAAIGQERNPGLVTYKEGARTYIAVDEALRWLSTKPTFVSTVFDNAADARIPEPQADAELPAFLCSLRARRGLSVEALAGLLGWDEHITAAYRNLEAGTPEVDLRPFTVEMLARMARALAPDNRPGFLRAVGVLLHARRLEQEIDREFPYDMSGAVT